MRLKGLAGVFKCRADYRLHVFWEAVVVSEWVISCLQVHRGTCILGGHSLGMSVLP